MTDITHPTKESIREYMEYRTQQSCEPPPSPEEIRRQLGWHMLPAMVFDEVSRSPQRLRAKS